MIKESNVHDLPNAKIQQHDSITDEEIAHFIQLLIHVIPVSHIFRCAGATSPCRLIIILDRYRYQESKQTEALLTFITLNQSNIHLLYFTYGTMNDYLLRGHLFYSFHCIPRQCIYQTGEGVGLPETSGEICQHLINNARLQFQKSILGSQDFLNQVHQLLHSGKNNIAAFMLHQSCEQLLRSIIILFEHREFRSHQLIALQEKAAFYLPVIGNIFHDQKRKELKWMMTLQTAYIDARYRDDYDIALNDLFFMKERMEILLFNIQHEMFK